MSMELNTGTSFLIWIGVLIFLGANLIALMSTRNLQRLLIASAIGELGYFLIGYGIGHEAFAASLLTFTYQIAARGLSVLAVWGLISSTKAWDCSAMRGMGRRAPMLGLVFGFSMFAAAGFSPLGGIPGRTMVLEALADHHAWLMLALVSLGLASMAIYSAITVQHICLSTPQDTENTPPPSMTLIWSAGGISVVMACMAFWPDVVFTWFGAQQHGELLAQTSPLSWPLVISIQVIGGAVLYMASRYNSRLRDIAAVALSAITCVLIWFEPNLDPTSRLYAQLVCGLSFIFTLYAIGSMSGAKRGGEYWFFQSLMTASLIGVSLAETFGNFLVFWEMMTWSSYVLIVHNRTEKALKSGLLYFTMCTVGVQLLHCGVLSLYSQSGSLDFTHIMATVDGLPIATGTIALVLLCCGFAIKSAFFPVHQWLPSAYANAPSVVSAPLSGLVTKAGLFGIIKVFYLVFGIATVSTYSIGGMDAGILLSIFGCLTLLYGEIKALKEPDAKRMLAYSSLAQIGEIAAIVGLGTSLAATASLMHATNHAIMKGLLFLAIGALIMRSGKRQVSELAGLGRVMPITSGCAVIASLAAMGLPPFNGFVSKFLMIYAAAEAGNLAIAATILLGGLISCIYYIRVARLLFFHPYAGSDSVTEAPKTMLAAMLALAVVIVIGGVAPQIQLDWIAPAVADMAARGNMAMSTVPNVTLPWTPETIIVAVGSIVTLAVGRYSTTWAGRVSVGALLAAACVIVLRSAEYDRLSFWFALLISTVGAGNMAYATGYLHHSHMHHRFYASFAFMIAGLLGLASSNDAFGFFGFWEVMSSWPLYFALIHEETREARREGFKYFMFNASGANLIFLGIAMLGIQSGSMSFHDIGNYLLEAPLMWTGPMIVLILTGMVMKAAQLPIRIDYQMHPATAPTPVSGYISAVLLKCAPFGILKLGAAIGGGALLTQLGVLTDLSIPMYVIAAIAALTILYAGSMAMLQTGLKELLIYSTVSQLAYILLGLALGSDLGVAGGLMHWANHTMLKNLLFLGAGCIMARLHISEMNALGGLGKRMPITFGLFLFAGLSLAGLPPLNGFSSKWLIFEAAFGSGHYMFGIAAMVGSLLTLSAILKFVHSAFLGTAPPSAADVTEAPARMLIPMGLMAIICVIAGIFPGLLLTPIADIQAELGLPPIETGLLTSLPGMDGWNQGGLTVLLLALFGLMSVYLRTGRKPHGVTKTHLHMCGVTNIPATTTHVVGSNLYETADKVIRGALKPRTEN